MSEWRCVTCSVEGPLSETIAHMRTSSHAGFVRARTITCADHADPVVAYCDACKASAHALAQRAKVADRTVADQAAYEATALMYDHRVADALHRFRLASLVT